MLTKRLVVFYVITSELLFLVLAFFSWMAVAFMVHAFHHSGPVSFESCTSPYRIAAPTFYQQYMTPNVLYGVFAVSGLAILLAFLKKGRQPGEIIISHLCILSLQVLGLFAMLAIGVCAVESMKQMLILTDVPYSPFIWLIIVCTWLVPGAAAFLLTRKKQRKETPTGETKA
jgi:hypothetical protein